MASGGYRAGAGRPKGSKSRKAQPIPPSDIRAAAKASRLSPLEYMMQVLNDEEADPTRRDRMAIAAAPFVHVRPAEASPGKKQQRNIDALEAEVGTSWESLLQ